MREDKNKEILILIEDLKIIKNMAEKRVRILQIPMQDIKQKIYDMFLPEIELCDMTISDIGNMPIEVLIKNKSK